MSDIILSLSFLPFLLISPSIHWVLLTKRDDSDRNGVKTKVVPCLLLLLLLLLLDWKQTHSCQGYPSPVHTHTVFERETGRADNRQNSRIPFDLHIDTHILGLLLDYSNFTLFPLIFPLFSVLCSFFSSSALILQVIQLPHTHSLFPSFIWPFLLPFLSLSLSRPVSLSHLFPLLPLFTSLSFKVRSGGVSK